MKHWLDNTYGAVPLREAPRNCARWLPEEDIDLLEATITMLEGGTQKPVAVIHLAKKHGRKPSACWSRLFTLCRLNEMNGDKLTRESLEKALARFKRRAPIDAPSWHHSLAGPLSIDQACLLTEHLT